MATFGETNILGSSWDTAGNVQAQKFTLGEAGTVTSMSLYLTAAGDDIRLAIYDHDAGNDKPGDLLAESASDTAAEGWTQLAVSVALSPGTYWLAQQKSGGNGSGRYDASGRESYDAQAYGAFPASWPGGSTEEEAHYSIYATYTPGAPAPTVGRSFGFVIG